MQDLRTQAADKGAHYEWMDAANLYEQALKQIGSETNPPSNAKINEVLGNCYFKGAFQVGNREEFKPIMRLAKLAFDKASSAYTKEGFMALSTRAKARSRYATYWLSEKPEERRAIMEACVSLAEEALRGTQSKEDYVLTRRDAVSYLRDFAFYNSDWKELNDICQRGISIGEEALTESRDSDDREQLLETLFASQATLLFARNYTQDSIAADESKRAALRTSEKITEISKKLDSPYANCISRMSDALSASIQGNEQLALGRLAESLAAAELTRDSLLLGLISYLSCYTCFWMIVTEETLEERERLVQKALDHAARAVKMLEISLDGSTLASTYEYMAETHWAQSNYVEVEAEQKKAELREAVKIARKGMRYHDYNFMDDVGHALSKSIYFLATLTTDSNKKEQLFSEALPIREESARLHDRLTPDSWNRGVMYNYLALLKTGLANLKSDRSAKIHLLKGAQHDMKVCVELCSKRAISHGQRLVLAGYLEWYGDILSQIHQPTQDPEIAQRAINTYERAIEQITTTEREMTLPDILWKKAKMYIRVGDHKQASHAFTKASEAYRHQATKVAATAPLFEDLSLYMKAWAEIEEARLGHEEEDYSNAGEHYAKASGFLQSTKKWNHIAGHYSACSFMEKAESWSQKDKQDVAIEDFSSAVKGFQESNVEIESARKPTSTHEESQEVDEWLSISGGRITYCKGRIDLEEAELLDKKGEKKASARKYHSASEAFKTLEAKSETKEGRGELETLRLFCDAWASMKQAETGGDSRLYHEAAETFTKAKETGRGRFRLLASANASLCKALEAGVHFRSSQDTSLYSEIKKQLQSAESNYQEGGFENPARWTQATQRLFDALTYLADGEVEREPKKKAELYHLAERHLTLAAKLYGEAGFEAKKGETQRQLQKVRDEKMVLLSPMEALTENPAISGASVSQVSFARDQAAGVEQFASANIVGNISIPEKEVQVGSELSIEFEIANVGKTAATLIKLENIVPEGFELNRTKASHRVDNGHINMKGKRLDYLKTDEVKIALRAHRRGSYEFGPRILFVDERGNYKSYEFEPVSLIVKELGISGWVRGSG